MSKKKRNTTNICINITNYYTDNSTNTDNNPSTDNTTKQPMDKEYSNG